MTRKIHDIFDVILKLIALLYGTEFLRYIGCDCDFEKECNVEITTIKGNKLYLDFLCLLKDNTLQHIEFEYPKAESDDLKRFFNYNITSQVKHQRLTETAIVNFTKSHLKEKHAKIGKSKSFHPHNFYIGDIEFDKIFENINIKATSNEKLTSFEEITLLVRCLEYNFKNKVETLNFIAELLKKEELFDEAKFEFIKTIVKLEIDNLLTKREKDEIKEEIEMSPQAQETIIQVIREVNTKVLAETKEEGIEEGIEKGIEKGREEKQLEIAQNLKETLDDEEISRVTGLTLDRIQNLK
ncbi:MAG: hypothetical protein IJ122_05070 [Methanobrevibacter sp.]|nr:hypothetical protein [Methanobrevibacter sp.]